MIKVLKIIVVGIVLASTLPWMAANAQETQVPVVSFAVDVTDPASGVIQVEATIPADLLPDSAVLDLTFWDAQDHPGAVTGLTAMAAGEMLAIEPDAANLFEYRIVLPAVAADVMLTYTVDPTYFPPGYDHNEILNAAGRLTGELGVLRLSGIVPMMQFDTAGYELTLAFDLPAEWTIILPWSDDHTLTLPPNIFDHSEYLAVGPFDVETITVSDLVVKFASLPGNAQFTAQTARDILVYMVELMGSAPQANTVAVTIVPENFLFGGSAGRRTIFMNPDAHAVAHEMFHWWNDEQLTADDAGWFREGFTDYYSFKIVFGIGLWPVEVKLMVLSQMQDGVAMMESDPPRSLAELSLLHMQDANASGLIYYKGNLFAWYLDKLLEAEGRSLDEVMRAILNGDYAHLTSADLQVIFHDVYDGAVDEAFDLYVNQGAALPDLLQLDAGSAD